jgi:bla regulator protein blaR1
MTLLDLSSGLLLSTTVKSSLLILLVAVIQWIGREQIPAGWRYAMWLLVVARLLMPVAPESRFSMFNLVSGGPQPVSVEFASTAATRSPEVPSGSPHEQPTEAPVRRLELALIALWAAGALLLAGRSLHSSMTLARRLRSAVAPADQRIGRIVAECAAELSVRRPLEVLETEAVGSPALHGFLRPKLLVPPDLLSSFSEEELRYIALHELAHLRRADVPVNVLAAAVECIHWFNPLVWVALSRMREERELACDRAALSRLRPAERSDYGRTMLKLLDCFRTSAFSPAIVGMASRQDEMKRRILMITAFRKSSRASLAFAGMVALMAFASLTDAQTVKHRVMKMEMPPEAKATFDRLAEPLNAEFTETSVLEVAQSIAARAGLTVTVAPDASAALAEAPKVSLKAEKIPAHVALIHALSSVDLGVKFNSTGFEITKGEGMPRVKILTPGAEGAHGEKVVIINGKEAHGDLLEKHLSGEASADGATRHIVIRKRDAASGAEKLEDRVIVLKPEGAEAAGKPRVRILNGEGATLELKVHRQ